MNSLTLETVQWTSLPDIDEVEPLNDTDAAVLEEIRQILLRSGKASRFGVCLLHKHFDLADDEVAIEYTDVEQRISNVVVEKRADKDREAIQTVWRFQDGAPTMGTVCIARCGKSGMTHSRAHERRSV